MKRLRLCLAAGIIALTAMPAAAQDTCRQALALGLDVSGSVDATEYRLQLDGLAFALEDRDVRAAVLASPGAPLRLMVFEWSGMFEQRILLDWAALDTPAALDRVIAHLRNTQSAHINDPSTGVASAILFGAAQLANQSGCWTRTLDISGDGPANVGRHPRELTEEELGRVIVNGLIIGPNARANTTKNLSNVKTLQDYYQSFVIRGPGAFVETADGYEDFAQAMRRKLLREIAPPALSALPTPSGYVQ